MALVKQESELLSSSPIPRRKPGSWDAKIALAFPWERACPEISPMAVIYLIGLISLPKAYSLSGPKRRFSMNKRQRRTTMRRLAITGIER